MPNLFSVETTFFEILGYPVSYIEFVGTVLYFASVWLIARKNSLTWPVGIVSVILYMVLFFQFSLYSDFLEQIYYLIASAYGWWAWSRGDNSEKVATRFSKPRTIIIWAAATLVIGIALGSAMSQVHGWWPTIFPEPAALPMLDAITTVMSLAAMWLLTLKRAESWLYWIIVDISAIYVYFTKEIVFVGLQYVVLTGLAIYGFVAWRKSANR
jgi:nicotinamide mononucleotide transporter